MAHQVKNPCETLCRPQSRFLLAYLISALLSFISTTWNVHGLITFLRTSCMFSFHIRFENSFSNLVSLIRTFMYPERVAEKQYFGYIFSKINSFPVLCIGRQDFNMAIPDVHSVRFSRPWNLWAVPCISYWETDSVPLGMGI